MGGVGRHQLKSKRPVILAWLAAWGSLASDQQKGSMGTAAQPRHSS
jgi:hypothetical protein